MKTTAELTHQIKERVESSTVLLFIEAYVSLNVKTLQHPSEYSTTLNVSTQEEEISRERLVH